MNKIFNIEDWKEWDEIVCSFADYDVFYLSGYVRAFQLHGDGVPQMYYYEDRFLRGIYVYMKRKTAIDGIYDSISPYGYGGFLIEGNTSEENLKNLWFEYENRMKEENIVDNFVRYHPVLDNATCMEVCSNVTELGKSVVMDLTSESVIWANIHSKNRNMIRKAEKNNVIINHGQCIELIDEFIKIYNATMDKDKADKYYYFKKDFYLCIFEYLKNNYEIFWAEYNGKIIAMSIMIFANGRLNYYLSGSDAEYRNLAPSNLLLYKAALWGCENGMKTFLLGGGVGSGEDNLFKFKIAFNRYSNYKFSIAKHIFDDTLYRKLVEERASRDKTFNLESNFFPLYRS